MKRFSPDRPPCRVRSTAAVALALALVLALASPAQRVHAQTTHTPWQNLTQSQLTAVWWQWALSIPVTDSPLFDDTGAKAYNGQPYSDLLFLAGTFTITQLQNGDLLGQVTRSISVKQGTALFFPLLNSETDNVCGTPHLGGNCFSTTPFPNVLSVPELRALAAAQQDPATNLHVTLTPTDDINVGYARLQSPPFAYTLPAADNIYQFFGIEDVGGTVAPAVSDGYWSFIPGTLPPGNYTLEFGGSIPINSIGNTFTEAITYEITVTP